jgi:DNA mismatch endonuclease (patch repair protein)
VADTFTRRERSWIMGRVLGRGNASTERVLLALLRSAGLAGWRRHLPLAGNPDFAFPSLRVIVFVDGCFWHSCPRHLRLPADHRDYWVRKIDRNRRRDRRTTRTLRADGWRVIRIWEHELRSPSHRRRALSRIVRAVGEARRGAGGRRAAGRVAMHGA